MKNTIENPLFNILVYKRGDVYIGICKETGYVEAGESLEAVTHRLINGTKAIFQTVKDNPALIASINQRPPLKHLLLFYLIPILYSFKNLFRNLTLERFNLTATELF